MYPQFMRVANYYNNSDIRIEERPVPKIGPGEVLLRVQAVGICGSDVMEWYRLGTVPRVLGHEMAGEVVEVGRGVKDLKPGDRVAASHHVPCFQCHYCRLGHETLCDTIRTTNFDPGGFSEWIRLPEINVRYGVYLLPEQVSYEDATLIEPLACVLRGQEKVGVRAGQTLLVLGCGPAGLLHVMLAKSRGVRRILACDLVDYRLEAARRFGADEALHPSSDVPERIRALNEGRLPDVVVACSGSREVTLQALNLAGRGASVLFFAPQSPDQEISLKVNDLFWERGVSLASSYAASPEDHRKSLELIRLKRVPVKELITHRLGLSEVAKGFTLVAGAQESLKVILDPTR